MGQTPFATLVGGYPETKLLLDAAERAFLTAVRNWVAGYRRDYDPIPGIYRDLDAAGAGGAAFSLNEFLAGVAETASRPIAIHAPCCDACSDDEMLLVFAAMLAQSGRMDVAERSLCRLISCPAAAAASEPLKELARHFANAGLCFARRQPRLIGQSPEFGQACASLSRTIH